MIIGFQKKKWIGGRVVGVSSIQIFVGYLDFFKLCKAPKFRLEKLNKYVWQMIYQEWLCKSFSHILLWYLKPYFSMLNYKYDCLFFLPFLLNWWIRVSHNPK